MPTYDYQCQKCGYNFEAFQSMKDEQLKKCPQCGKMSLKKLISGGSGIIFKGSGFYLTDYKNKNKESKPKEKQKAKKEDKPKTTE
jgi:putative FmdB family regulatory protein